MKPNTPDLTKFPPRSPRVRLGGYVTLPRILDKCRAAIAGTRGEYKFNCPLDQRWFEFTGVNAELFMGEVAKGKGDGEMLTWINAKAKHKRTDVEAAAWSAAAEQRAPSDPESREHFNELHRQSAPRREDVVTWFDLLDVDDFVSFGGKA